MQRHLIILLCGVMLVACGGDSGADKSSASSGSNDAPLTKSSLREFMSEEKICDMVSVPEIQALFDTQENIDSRPSSYRDNYSCTYSWEPLDKAEREKRFMQSMMAVAKGEGKKLSLRERALEHQITISLKDTKQGADSFVPRKLSEQEINAQIASAKKQTAKRLSEEQKAIAGDVANDMVEGMLRKANQNITLSDVGDAAYWSNFGPGSMEVLDGDVHISISPMIAATKEADIENAKRIVAELLN